MKLYNRNLTLVILSLLFFYGCNKEKEIQFTESNPISANSFSFDANEQSGKITFEETNSTLTFQWVEQVDWAEVKVEGNNLEVSVLRNELLKPRLAAIKVSIGVKTYEILIRQAGRRFSDIPQVTELNATPLPGQVKLNWVNPKQDNFSHVIVSYKSQGDSIVKVLEAGTTEYLVENLLSSEGLYTFYVQSIDKDGDKGNVSEIQSNALKLVSFQFEKTESHQYVPYYFRSNNVIQAGVRIGSREYEANQAIPFKLEIDLEVLNRYNAAHQTSYLAIDKSWVDLSSEFLFKGISPFENLNLSINIEQMENGNTYALPIRIKIDTENVIVDPKESEAVFVFHVDDLSGWYTVDRLSKSGESASQYPSNEKDRRRYIKRVGPNKWETGYLFQSYAQSETQVGSNITNRQFIEIDTENSSIIRVQQGVYVTSEHLSRFDVAENEFIIEYLYRDWANYWTHERMYNRSFTK